MLVKLQRAQRTAVNGLGGYWIAEADPNAAPHGLTCHVQADTITWAVLATDGAADVIDHTAHSWPDLAQAHNAQLATLLAQLANWEATADPNGRPTSGDAPRRQDPCRRRLAPVAERGRLSEALRWRCRSRRQQHGQVKLPR